MVHRRETANVALFALGDRSGGFSASDLREFVVPYFRRAAPHGPQQSSVCCLMFGFLVEVFLPKLPKGIERQVGVLWGNAPVFVAPLHDVFEVPEI